MLRFFQQQQKKRFDTEAGMLLAVVDIDLTIPSVFDVMLLLFQSITKLSAMKFAVLTVKLGFQ